HGFLVGDRIVVSAMANFSRRRETFFLRMLQTRHAWFEEHGIGRWFDEEIPTRIEGGDVLVLSPTAIAIGLSERTTEDAIEYVARRLLVDPDGVRRVLVVQIPEKRRYMHLDTVLTMVDRDKFVIYPGIASA